MRTWTKTAILTGALATGLACGTLYYGVKKYPTNVQRLKSKVLPFLSFKDKYDIPNNAERESPHPLKKKPVTNQRETLSERIGELVITLSGDWGGPAPGGMLLPTSDCRVFQPFGKYTSYDPVKTQEVVQGISDGAAERKKRVLVYDEGEGGYIYRIGTLPPARELGDYYTKNIIGPSIAGFVEESADAATRARQVDTLFTSYARELHDRGVDVVFGPVLDVVNRGNGDNLIARDKRNFSSKYLETKEIALLYINAMHRFGIKVTGKHFLSAGLTDDGDIHEEVQSNPERSPPLRRSAYLYKKLASCLDAVMVTHVGNPLDGGRPYCLSKRAMLFLTSEDPEDAAKGAGKSPFKKNHLKNLAKSGIGFDGLLIVDEITMKGLIKYVEDEPLSKRGKALTAGCKSTVAKAAVLAMDQGIHALIVRDGNIGSIVEGIAYAYENDPRFRRKVDIALEKYELFVKGRTCLVGK
ncbi:MAG: glycoside hydrolase family 3 N-terminal domain-containing protein [Candidatus Micrarchaeia archaeon]|jgi:beta-glucosidase-like glycosyl hydrolase